MSVTRSGSLFPKLTAPRSYLIADRCIPLELVCPEPTADAILTYVSHHYFDRYACLAWLSDVSVVRGVRYTSSDH